MNAIQTGATPANGALTASLSLGFRFLAWLNGLGVLLILVCATGMVQTDLVAGWLRLPMAAFLAGLVLCGLGLLWSYLVLASLFAQMVRGQTRRTHWIPLFCAMVAYSLSMVAFVAGCWFTLGLSIFSQHFSESNSPSEEATPEDQSEDGQGYIHDGTGKTVRFSPDL
jgi:hypothetical protein